MGGALLDRLSLMDGEKVASRFLGFCVGDKTAAAVMEWFRGDGGFVRLLTSGLPLDPGGDFGTVGKISLVRGACWL